MIVQVLLFGAVAGLVCCTGFLLLAVVAAIRFDRRHVRAGPSHLPPVTLLKPLCGWEPNLSANLESFFCQQYPQFEIVFGTRDANDPSLEIVRSVQRHYPQVPVKVIYSGEPERPNAKVCSLEKMIDAASFDYLVISDSDVQVASDYLAEVVPPLLNPEIGMVTCLYRGVPTGGLWSALEALGMSVEMTAGVIVADALEGMKFALGPTMALRREVLQAAGGMAALAEYCSDDYLLGQSIHRLGYRVILSRHVIDHIVLNRSFADSVAHQVRWMKSTRFSRRKGHIGTGLTFAMPFGILGFAAGIAADNVWLGFGLFMWAVINRVILSAALGWGVVRDRRALRYCWLYPLRDLMGFFYWVASFFGREIVWRDIRYRLERHGKMTRLGPRHEKPASKAVAADYPA
jgi:ceramide glucosyltransferase